MLSLCPQRSPRCTMSHQNFHKPVDTQENPTNRGPAIGFLIYYWAPHKITIWLKNSLLPIFHSWFTCSMQTGKITSPSPILNKEPKQIKCTSVINLFILHITIQSCALYNTAQHLWVSHFWFISNIDIIYPCLPSSMASMANPCSFKRQLANTPGKTTWEALRKLVAKKGFFFESFCQISHAIKFTNTYLLDIHVHLLCILAHMHKQNHPSKSKNNNLGTARLNTWWLNDQHFEMLR